MALNWRAVSWGHGGCGWLACLGLCLAVCPPPLFGGESGGAVPGVADLSRLSDQQLRTLQQQVQRELKRRREAGGTSAPGEAKAEQETGGGESSSAGTKEKAISEVLKVLTGKEGSGSVEALGDLVLSNEDVRAGLKEALSHGIKAAIATLGREDGFFKFQDVKILLPQRFAKAEEGLRMLGQGAKVDDFVLTMNRAAEKATPEVVDIFAGALSQLTIEDAKKILAGTQDEATRFFKKSCTQDLASRIKPLVAQMTEKAGATRSYKSLLGQLGPLEYLVKGSAFDLDEYVTTKALDGIFFMVALEEKKIRENPAARTTELLRKVFGKR